MQVNNLEKWKNLLEKRYRQKNLTKQEIFTFANTVTNFFDLLLKFDREDRLKNKTNENEYDRTKTKN